MKHSTKRLRAKLSRESPCVGQRDPLHRLHRKIISFRLESTRAGEHTEFAVAKYSNKWTIS